MSVLTIAIAGGTGSGKSALAQAVFDAFPGEVTLVEQDWYYYTPEVPAPEIAQYNFDAPAASDLDLMAHHVAALHEETAVHAPIYDMTTHERSGKQQLLVPQRIIVAEGLHVLHHPGIREACALRVFLDAPADLRLARRIQRDTIERGRTVQDVLHRYLHHARPVHTQVVEPSRRHATLLLSTETGLHGPAEALRTTIAARLREETNTAATPAEAAQ